MTFLRKVTLSAPLVAAWLDGKSEADLFLSAITLGEIEREIARDAVIVTGNEDDFLPTSVAVENPFRV